MEILLDTTNQVILNTILWKINRRPHATTTDKWHLKYNPMVIYGNSFRYNQPGILAYYPKED
jgi:hypothetical protein